MDNIKLLIIILSGIYLVFSLCTVIYKIKLYIITAKYKKITADIISISDGDYIPNFNEKDWFKQPKKKYLVFKYNFDNQSYTNFSHTALKEAKNYEYKTMPLYIDPDNPKKNTWIQTDITYRQCKLEQMLTYGDATYTFIIGIFVILYIISEIASII